LPLDFSGDVMIDRVERGAGAPGRLLTGGGSYEQRKSEKTGGNPN
jgi:hypothetical protein